MARWLRTLVSFQKKGARQCFSRLPAVIDGIYMSWLESWVSSRCIWLSSGSRTNANRSPCRSCSISGRAQPALWWRPPGPATASCSLGRPSAQGLVVRETLTTWLLLQDECEIDPLCGTSGVTDCIIRASPLRLKLRRRPAIDPDEHDRVNMQRTLANLNAGTLGQKTANGNGHGGRCAMNVARVSTVDQERRISSRRFGEPSKRPSTRYS